MKPVLQFSDVRFSYRRRLVLESVDLVVSAGETVALTGKTGTGKSTLAMLGAGLLRPDRGAVELVGFRISHGRRSTATSHRRKALGMVFQNAELVPSLSARENVALPALLDGVSWEESLRRADLLLEELDVLSGPTPAHVLSGGEAQRVSIARALVNRPTVVIADEPTSSLDRETRARVTDLLLSTCRAREAGLLLVTHDEQLASRADRHLELEACHIQSRTPEQVRQ